MVKHTFSKLKMTLKHVCYFSLGTSTIKLRVFQDKSDAVFTNFGVVQKLTTIDVVMYITCPFFLNKHTILVLDPNTPEPVD